MNFWYSSCYVTSFCGSKRGSIWHPSCSRPVEVRKRSNKWHSLCYGTSCSCSEKGEYLTFWHNGDFSRWGEHFTFIVSWHIFRLFKNGRPFDSHAILSHIVVVQKGWWYNILPVMAHIAVEKTDLNLNFTHLWHVFWKNAAYVSNNDIRTFVA